MKKLLLLTPVLAICFGFEAQNLCQPTFANGCFDWHTNLTNFNGVDYNFDGNDCTESDFTDQVGSITAGQDTEIQVESGNWCGVSVWIDLNRDDLLDDSENFYHEGNGGNETHLFTFNINVPTTTINGRYTIRIITHWGSDGFNPGDNGNGGCGAYQYGNFQDYSVDIDGGVASLEELDFPLHVTPNPSSDLVSLKVNAAFIGKSYELFNALGQKVYEGVINGIEEKINMKQMESGIYFVKLESSAQSVKLLKK
mgnify:CR=1 FL=1